MEKKDSSLPRMHQSLHVRQKAAPFKVRPTLASKDKENTIDKSLQNVKAINFINKAKSFNSPQLIFALNDSIRLETSLGEYEVQPSFHREHNFHNKTFHNFGLTNNLQHKSKSKGYALNQQREKAIQLSRWMTEKLEKIKFKQTMTLDDLLDYNQTVVNYGLGQIIESVRRRCKEEGQTLKMIWDNTFILFENLLNVLSTQLRTKDQELVNNQKQISKIFEANLKFLKNKNIELEKHLDLLYQKMKKIVLWNRSLRKDNSKKQIQLRISNYRLSSYTMALEQAVNMLLVESTEPNSLKLAKKIMINLSKQSVRLEHQKRGKKSKPLQLEAHQHVEKTARQFVTNWLKKYSLQEQQDIQDAIHLNYDQKIEIINMDDKKQTNRINIYDYFQAKCVSTQTDYTTADKSVQFQQKIVHPKTKNIGIETRKFYYSSVGIQINQSKQQNSKQKQVQYKQQTKYKRQNPIQRQNLGPKSFKNGKSQLKKKTSILGPLQSESDKFSKFTRGERGKLKKSRRSFDNRERTNEGSYIAQSDVMTKEQWQTKNDIFALDDKISEEFQEQQANDTNFYIEDIGDYRTTKFQQGWQNSPQKSDEFEQNIYNKADEIIKQNLHRNRRLGTQRYITQQNEIENRGYKSKSLKKTKFEQIYRSEMKNEYQQNKEQLISTVVRRRSFYKNNPSRKYQNQKSMMMIWYRPTRLNLEQKQRRELNQIDQSIYSYFNTLIKNLPLPLNYSKSKTYQQTCSLFSTVSSNLNPQKSIPKNKQFINLSVNGIMKFISRLLFDYLRKIRIQFQGFHHAEAERVYYPLSVILVDHMMHKYGLKDIAEKKIKDFMEKVSNFVGVSDKLNFLYRLFGVRDQLISADQLIIYMKCLVYFDVQKIIPIMYISKDFSIDRIVTDRQSVLNNIDEIINQFFVEELRVQIKWKIQRYFHIYQLTGVFDVQRIATMLIDEFVAVKKQQHQYYLPLYKNCQGNFFPNLFKTMQMYCNSQNLPPKYSKMLQQVFKNADLLDENYGKSISQLRFIGICVKIGFPKFQEIKGQIQIRNKQFIKAAGVSEQFEVQSEQTILKMKKKYKIKISTEKEAPDYWLWTCSQMAYDVPLINAYSLLGHLKYFQSSYEG